MTIQQTIINLNKVLGEVKGNLSDNSNGTQIISKKSIVKYHKKEKKSSFNFEQHFINYIHTAERINGRCAMSGFIAGQLIYSISHVNPIELIQHDPVTYGSLFLTDIAIISPMTIANNKYDDIMMLEYEMYVCRIIMLFWLIFILNS